MTTVADIPQKFRSKNAGPLWITVDIFYSTSEGYRRIERFLSKEQVVRTLGIASEHLQRYHLPDLIVIKFHLPRPFLQGTRNDGDMRTASFANLIAEAEISE